MLLGSIVKRATDQRQWSRQEAITGNKAAVQCNTREARNDGLTSLFPASDFREPSHDSITLTLILLSKVLIDLITTTTMTDGDANSYRIISNNGNEQNKTVVPSLPSLPSLPRFKSQAAQYAYLLTEVIPRWWCPVPRRRTWSFANLFSEHPFLSLSTAATYPLRIEILAMICQMKSHDVILAAHPRFNINMPSVLL